MSRFKIPLILLGLAVVCGLLTAYVASDTVVPMAARGTGPGGVSVTTGGWLSLFLTGLGTGGFTLSGIVAAIWSAITMLRENPEQAGQETAKAFRKTKVLLFDGGELGAFETLYKSVPDEQKPYVAAGAWAHGEGILATKFGPKPTGGTQ